MKRESRSSPARTQSRNRHRQSILMTLLLWERLLGPKGRSRLPFGLSGHLQASPPIQIEPAA